jgi:hypothetical protein
MFETNSYVRCLLIDFSKAFDTADHAIIVKKLSSLSLSWNIINWFRHISFLICRNIAIKNGSLLSLLKPINRSTVQGSGIGPTLFIIHESDLVHLLSNNIILKYADDTNLLVPENSDASLSQEFDSV